MKLYNFNCRCCSSDRLKSVCDLGLQPWGNDFVPIEQGGSKDLYPLELFYCEDCGMVQLNYTVPKEKMFMNHSYLSGTTKTLQLHFVNVGKQFEVKFPYLKKSKILDVGGNDGTFLKFFKDNDYTVVNVDSGVLQSDLARSNGITTYNAFFNETSAQKILKDYGKFKAIHGSGIFFHLEELHSAFQGLKMLLDVDGVLIAEFIYLPEMMRKVAYDQIYHEHLLYYSLTTFNRLLSMFGLEVFDVHFAPIHGGTCIAYAGHPDQYSKTDALVTALKDEESSGILTYNKMKEFEVQIKRNGVTLKNIVSDIKKEGKTIYCLGAPVKGTTLLHFSQLSEKEISYATEVNEHKCGTYYPGTKIPVVLQGSVPEPDYYLLLAWNFQEEILPRLENFRKNGGKVIIPVPEARVI